MTVTIVQASNPGRYDGKSYKHFPGEDVILNQLILERRQTLTSN